MCGIIGVIGACCEKKLLEGLEKLEYRGYDSAGLVVLRDKNFYTEKALGGIENLKSKVKSSDDFGIGIAHTRWATHGGITIENTHPHFSSNKNVALVHNGIIENFEVLKKEIDENSLYSQTDSEVVAKMFDKGININKLYSVLQKINGTYAFAIISKSDNKIFFAKNKSPLYVSLGEDVSMVASDPSCFVGHSTTFIPIDDGEFGYISKNKVEIYDKNKKLIIKKKQKINFSITNESKNEYEHFMMKEICDTPSVVKTIISTYKCPRIANIIKKIKDLQITRIYLVGCGTAYHSCLFGQKVMQENLKVDVYAEKASEFSCGKHILNPKTLCIFVSQSGETIDTLNALAKAKRFHCKTLSVTNVPYSALAKKTDFTLPVCAGQEKAVASTKAYIAQCLVLYCIAKMLFNKQWLSQLKIFAKMLNINNDDQQIKSLAKLIATKDKAMFIGKNYDYISALEGSLKLKEITYIFSFAEPSGELKHGPLALVENGMPVIIIATDKRTFSKTLNNAYETFSRGGELFLFTSMNVEKKAEEKFKSIIKVPSVGGELSSLLAVIPLQKLAYFTAVERGVNPDKPRNLAKSVTVE